MAAKHCFVIMSFSKSKSHNEAKWTEIYNEFFKEAWESFGFTCSRTEAPRGSITKDIIQSLFSADIVFADLTDSNPNVMYELGVRHSFKKPSMMVKKKDTIIPFDVDDYKVIDYNYNVMGLKTLKANIKAFIEDVERFPNKSDNPVWDFMQAGNFVIDYYRGIETIQKLKGLRDELAYNLKSLDKFLMSAKAGTEWVDRPTVELLVMTRGDALINLRVNRYVDFPDKYWQVFYYIDEYYKACYALFGNLKSMPLSQEIVDSFKNNKDKLEQGINIVNKRITELELR